MTSAAPLSFDVGHTVTFTKTVTDQDVADFARLSGDTQSFHVDDAYAQQSRFGQRIAHGTLLIGFISAALGTKLAAPHETVIFLSQQTHFHGAVYGGDTITATLEVTKIHQRRRWVTLSATCTNQRNQVVLRGHVSVLVDPFPYS